MKNAVIFGVSGQDGSYLSELLVSKGYHVLGVIRRASVNTTERLINVLGEPNFELVEGDIIDASSVNSILTRYKPTECYNLAAQSHVATSFNQPSFTFQVNTVGVLNILEAIRNYSPATRFYQASTSEMFGANYLEKTELVHVCGNPLKSWQERVIKYQDESTPFSPRSPYAVAKVAAHNLVYTYRESYNLHASCGILFNHESERRGENFVTRKITKYIGKLSKWIAEATDGHYANLVVPKLHLGNIDSSRDWGHAEDYVRAMWLMLQQDLPDNYVVSTDETHSVREFLEKAFKVINIENWEEFIVIDPDLYRPADVEFLCGSSDKVREALRWKPEISFDQLVERMVRSDIDAN